MNWLRLVIKFSRWQISRIRKDWIINIYYPKHIPDSKIYSIVPSNIISKVRNVFIGENVVIKNDCLEIGRHTFIGNNTFIDSCSTIGSFCSISSDVKIGMRNHPLSYISTSPVFYSKFRGWVKEVIFNEANEKTVKIEEDVLISANAIIINGVKIGRGAVVGAGSVVTHDIPEDCLAAGNPARVIGTCSGFIEKRKSEMKQFPCFGEEYTLRGNISPEMKDKMNDMMQDRFGYIE